MRVLEEMARQQALEKPAALEPAPDIGQIGIELQHAQRVPAVDPGAADGEQQPDAVRVWRVGDLAAVEFQLVDGGFDELPVDPVGRQAAEACRIRFARRPPRRPRHVLQPRREMGVPVVGIVPAAVGQGRSQPGVDQGFAQRGGRHCRAGSVPAASGTDLPGIADVAREPGDARLVAARRGPRCVRRGRGTGRCAVRSSAAAGAPRSPGRWSETGSGRNGR